MLPPLPTDHHVLATETLFQGYFRLDRLHLCHARFAGGQTPAFTREIFVRGQVAALLPYDPVQDLVMLLQQFRAGCVAAGSKQPWQTEIIAGIIDGDEDAHTAARREAREEAHLHLGELILMHQYYVTPGGSDEFMNLFLAVAELTAGQTTLAGQDNEMEDIRSIVLPRAAALELLAKGQIQNSMTLIALQWLALHGEGVRARLLTKNVATPII